MYVFYCPSLDNVILNVFKFVKSKFKHCGCDRSLRALPRIITV